MEIRNMMKRISRSLTIAKRLIRDKRVRIEEAGRTLSGWAERIESREIDPWGGTADGLLTLLKSPSDEDIEAIKEAVLWLREHQQIRGTDKIEGGFSSTIPPIAHPITQCTAWALMALAEYFDKMVKMGKKDVIEELPVDDTVIRAIRWLLRHQNADGGWGLWRGDLWTSERKRWPESRVYPTAIAVRGLLRALKTITKHEEYFARRYEIDELLPDMRKAIDKGIKWLLDARNDKGTWGMERRAEGKVSHTAHALITLYEWFEYTGGRFADGSVFGKEEFDKVREQVREFILEARSEGGWEPVTENITDFWDPLNKSWGHQLTTTHFSTPWCIIALHMCGESLFGTTITGALEYLLSMQNPETGAFYFNRAAKDRDDVRVWAIHDAATCLDYVMKRLRSPEKMLEEVAPIVDENNMLREKLNSCREMLKKEKLKSIILDYGDDICRFTWHIMAVIMLIVLTIITSVFVCLIFPSTITLISAIVFPVLAIVIGLFPLQNWFAALGELKKKGPEELKRVLS